MLAVTVALVAPGQAGATVPCATTVDHAAVLCEVNAARAAAGRAPLAPRAALAHAAVAQARDMVARGYFAHTSPEGDGPAERVRRTGYLRRVRAWQLGEVLLWQAGTAYSAASVVAMWLASPPHRRVLLARAYAEAGAGVTPGIPLGGPFATGATVAMDLGFRGE
jgi:uncharacterized protein YkwD